MNTMHLVIQSPGLTAEATEQVAALAQASGIHRISATAMRLLKVQHDDATRRAVRRWCEDAGLDQAFLPAGRRLADCKVLAMDMDSTLINIECIDQIAELAGVGDQVKEITEAAMRGEIADFAESLRRRVALLQGVPIDILEQVYTQRLRLNPGAEQLVAGAHAAGLKVLLVSGGFTFFTDRLRERLQLEAAHANTLEVDNGILTGRLQGDILDGYAKAVHLRQLARACGATQEQTIAIGDGANDLKMLAAAGFSVAYRAKPIVREQAAYALNVSGLDGVLNWFEG